MAISLGLIFHRAENGPPQNSPPEKNLSVRTNAVDGLWQGDG
jgi:hypothetical protein